MEEINSTVKSKFNENVAEARKKNYHKPAMCGACGKWMRDDTMKRHMKTHGDLTDLKDDDAIRSELKKRKDMLEERERQREKVKKIAEEVGASPSCYEQSFPNIRSHIPINFDEELLQYNAIYLQKIDMGKKIHDALIKGTVIEDALPKHIREALYIFRKSRCPMDIINVNLRPWQKELIENIKVPTAREVIWVKGFKGNEGKTFFQKYIQSLFGYSRVAMLDLKSKTANILHALRKFPLSTTDIFFFNDARAINHETCCYTVLEHIKDGSATASKFNSEVIQFKTPNVVVVFSNRDPDMKQLSQDRWKVYYINKDGLSSQEKRLWKEKNIKRTCHTNFGRDSMDYI